MNSGILEFDSGILEFDESVLRDMVVALIDDEQMLRSYIKQLEEMNIGVLPLYTILVDIGSIKNYLKKTTNSDCKKEPPA